MNHDEPILFLVLSFHNQFSSLTRGPSDRHRKLRRRNLRRRLQTSLPTHQGLGGQRRGKKAVLRFLRVLRGPHLEGENKKDNKKVSKIREAPRGFARDHKRSQVRETNDKGSCQGWHVLRWRWIVMDRMPPKRKTTKKIENCVYIARFGVDNRSAMGNGQNLFFSSSVLQLWLSL